MFGKKFIFHFYALFFLILAISSCDEKKNLIQEIKGKSELRFSKFLKIKESETGVFIDITHPSRMNKTYKYFIARTKSEKTPKDYLRIEKENLSFIVFSATHIGMLEKLNQLSKIKGTCSKNLIHSAAIIKKIETGEIKDFGNELATSFEKIIELNPKIVIYSGFSGEFSKSSDFEKMNIIPIPNFDWQETHPLGKAEWILFFGYLTGTESQAKKHFNSVKNNYISLCKKAKEAKKIPTVLMGSKIGEYWYGPAGNSYGAKLLSDAKTNYLYKKTEGTASVELSLEKVFSEAKNTEFWINPGFPNLKLLEMNFSKATFFKAFKNKHVYCYTSDPNKYWELNGVQPDWILSDLIQIFHPELKLNQPMYFYKVIE